jgi:hypothetical protein
MITLIEEEVMNKQFIKNGAVIKLKMLASAAVTSATVIILLGISACSTTSKPEPPKNTTAPVATPPSNPPPKSSTAASTGKIPNSLVDAGEYGENIYDTAKANNWSKAAVKLTSLKNAAKQLRADLASATGDKDQLDKSITAIDQAIAAKDRQTAMREANQVTRIVAEMTAPFNPAVPIDVTRLDYLGRELEIWAEANDTAKLKATAGEINRTWEGLRPIVESHGGSATSKKFGDLVARVGSAKTPEEYAHLAIPLLDEVDNLEKVFEK